jgi:hypothetical protein
MPVITPLIIPKDQTELNEKILAKPNDPLIPEYVKTHVSNRLNHRGDT